jgi:glycosyltransferase involved in cell wall biosynthesis
MTPPFSLVLPVYNQADHIAAVVEQYRAVLQDVLSTFEIILVPNGCRDASILICETLARESSELRVQVSERDGWGRAVRQGLSAAKGEVLCYTNAARTGPSDLKLLALYGIANPNAVVKAHRRSRESLKRKVGSFLFNLECRALWDLPTWDVNATPKVFHRAVYEAINLTADGNLLDLELYAQCTRLGIPVIEIPIYSWYRHGGVSTTSYASAMRMYLGAYRLRRLRRCGPH